MTTRVLKVTSMMRIGAKSSGLVMAGTAVGGKQGEASSRQAKLSSTEPPCKGQAPAPACAMGRHGASACQGLGTSAGIVAAPGPWGPASRDGASANAACRFEPGASPAVAAGGPGKWPVGKARACLLGRRIAAPAAGAGDGQN